MLPGSVLVGCLLAVRVPRCLPACSGNLKIETSFYDADMFLGKTVVRIFYV